MAPVGFIMHLVEQTTLVVLYKTRDGPVPVFKCCIGEKMGPDTIVLSLNRRRIPSQTPFTL